MHSTHRTYNLHLALDLLFHLLLYLLQFALYSHFVHFANALLLEGLFYLGLGLCLILIELCHSLQRILQNSIDIQHVPEGSSED